MKVALVFVLAAVVGCDRGMADEALGDAAAAGAEKRGARNPQMM